MAGVHFPGLDLLAGLCFAGAVALSTRAIFQGAPLFWCALPFSLAAAALALHLYLNFSG